MKRTSLIAALLLLLLAAIPAHALIAPIPRPVPAPIPPAGWTYLWISPTYRTVTDRTWVPERIQLISEWRETSPGHMELIYRQVTIPGYWQTSTRQVLIADGHWELVRLGTHPLPFPNPRNPGTVGVNGYAQLPVEDLSKFSALTEWPK